MSRKAREQLEKRFREHVQRVSPAEESLTRGEVQDALREAGCEPETLCERLNTMARAIANAQRAKGKATPTYLQQAIDLSGGPEELPKDEKTALQKAKDWIRSLTAGPGVLTDDLQIIRAYRSRGDISEKDQRLLDSAEEKLKKQLKNRSDA